MNKYFIACNIILYIFLSISKPDTVCDWYRLMSNVLNVEMYTASTREGLKLFNPLYIHCALTFVVKTRSKRFRDRKLLNIV